MALHTVTTCDLANGGFDCQATSVIGPAGRKSSMFRLMRFTSGLVPGLVMVKRNAEFASVPYAARWFGAERFGRIR